MKKQKFIAGLLTAAVLILIIASAGCVQQPPSGDVQPADTIDFSKLTTAVEIYAEDSGTEFNVGDTIGVVLPGNKEKGIAWKIKGDDDGLLAEEGEFYPKNLRLPEQTGSQTFLITILKEGKHGYTITEPFSRETYSDTITAVKSDAEPQDLRSILCIIPLVSHPAYTGDAYEISLYGNPTTGYQWTAQDTEGLFISRPEYTPYDTDGAMVGSGGIYTWKVTAKEPGYYTFTALLERSGDDKPAADFTVTLFFTKDE